jgi:phage tail protein X
MQVRAQQGDTVDLLCWRHLGATSEVVEQVFEMNPDIAQFGPILPHGQLVTLPDTVPTATKQNQPLQLWD